MVQILNKSLILFVFTILNCLWTYAQEPGPLVSVEDITKDLEKAVCSNEGRLETAEALFISKGAPAEEIKIEEYGKTKNLVITIPGTGEGKIIIGAHFDKAAAGCGVIDNWSGVVIVANIFKAVREFKTSKTWIFVAFGREEEGLIGSKRMANAIPKDQRKSYCAMINFDSFGKTYPQAMRNTSDQVLIKLAEEISSELGLPFAAASINANADSTSFNDIDIPAVSLHGLDNSWREYLHTKDDQMAGIKPLSVYFGYRFGLSFANRIEEAPCREVAKKDK